jgi:5-methylthioribose kinase
MNRSGEPGLVQELTAENAAAFLRQRRWIGDGPVVVEELSGGVSNIVLRVEAEGRLFVVKQSRPQLRTRDEWFSDIGRIYREQEVMETLNPFLPHAVPKVLHADREHYVFTMEHAPPDARVWKAQLLAGEVDLERAEQAGRILGRIHEVTGRDTSLASGFRDRKVFVQLRVEPFYHRIQERQPEVAAAVEPLIEQLMSRADALCHGDFSPKNLLAHRDGLTLVDYETAHLGEPAMDLGFFFSHLLLKSVKRSQQSRSFFDLTRAAWRGYESEVRFCRAANLRQRSIGHLGVCLLARIDGTSPVDYLTEEPKRDLVRRVGRSLLLDRPTEWEDVLGVLERELLYG